MIKINLLKDAASQRPQGGSQFNVPMPNFGKGGGGMGGDNSALIQRFAFLLVPIILAYAYGWYSNYQLDGKVKALTVEGQQVDQKVEGLKPELDEIEKLNTEKNKITTEVNAVKDLSKRRYNYVKILDALQTLIPEKAWLTKLGVKERVIAIEGRANDDSTISNFMQNLEESAYFQNVTWESSREVTEPQGVVKQFSIQFNLENLP
jgi:type IV pilus assembly protein PilN